MRCFLPRAAAPRDVQRHLPSLLRPGWRLRGERRPGEVPDALQDDRRAEVRSGRGPGRGDPGRLHHHQAADRGLGPRAGGSREERLVRPGWGGRLRQVPAARDGADLRGVRQLGEVPAGAGGEVQAEPGGRAAGGPPARGRLPQHGGAHEGRHEGHRGHLAGPEGQARAAVAHRPQPRHETEPAEERVHEVLSTCPIIIIIISFSSSFFFQCGVTYQGKIKIIFF